VAKKLERIAKPDGAKRVVVIADLHCGHRVGLTPPPWQQSHERAKKWAAHQHDLWAYYSNACERLQPVDCVIVNGDCIDGKGYRSGGTELIVVDRNEQATMASHCIKRVHAPKAVIIRGTPYHVGEEEDYEDLVAASLEADAEVKVGDHEWVDVNGCIFDVKHHIGRSTIPHGKATPILKDALWNLVYAARDEQEKANIIVRSHVHMFVAVQDFDVLALVTPGLQGYGSKYGQRRCSNTVDFGLVAFDVMEDGAWMPAGRSLREFVRSFSDQKPKAVKV